MGELLIHTSIISRDIEKVMEAKSASFWWLKSKTIASTSEIESGPKKTIYAGGESVSTNYLVDLFEKEAEKGDNNDDVDVGSIIEEINRVAAQSPLGPYESKGEERSVDELMKQAEKIYMESSKSFEQLSQRSKTSQNISDISLNSNKDSTPTPKSLSPLPLDPQIQVQNNDLKKDVGNNESYSEDFCSDSTISTPSVEQNILPDPNKTSLKSSISDRIISRKDEIAKGKVEVNTGKFTVNNRLLQSKSDTRFDLIDKMLEEQDFQKKKQEIEKKQASLKDDLIRTLEEDNDKLKNDVKSMKIELEQTQIALKELRLSAKAKTPTDVNFELNKALDELKDTKEINTSLQLQLDTLTQTHQILKNSQDDLINQNKNLERKLTEIDTCLAKYKHELLNVQRHRDKLLDIEVSLNKLLDIEKLQTKNLRIQNENDAKCIQDLNRQIKEMERIIARKHPDSVSALIVAAKNDASDSSLTARKLLEDRIKKLESELVLKEKESTQVFTDIQEKFNQMKAKYEHHIEDLELHVSDLKVQLKKKNDCYDIYTQTIPMPRLSQDIPEKESTSIGIQTDIIHSTKPPKVIAVKSNVKHNDGKSEAHLLATIRGLQTDLSNKEKLVMKMQRELDELKKTNRRLQKEREGSLRSLNEKKDYRTYPEKLVQRSKSPQPQESNTEESSKEDDLDKLEFEKIKHQLQRIEMDYQNLKKKRIHDLNALQEAHEREILQYIQNLQPLREQLELQQLTINTLQSQLAASKEELAIVTVERDHLNEEISNNEHPVLCNNRKMISDSNVESLQKKLAVLEKRYEEREHRLRAIVNGLAQKNIMNRNCEQCAERQQQLISYKMELDQLLSSLRALK